MSARDYAADCELVADAFQSLAHFDPELKPAALPDVAWGNRVPPIIVTSRAGDAIIVRLDRERGEGWLISGGVEWRTRVVSGEDLVESVAALWNGYGLDAPVAYADWSGERRS